jgi:hypothetical protein
MTVRQKRGVVGVSSLALIGATFVVAGLTYRRAVSASAPLRIQLVAKGMDFVRFDDTREANPAIRLPADREVEIELVNEDPGSQHNLAIAELNLKTRLLKFGEKAVLRFTAPPSGSLTYLCTVHPVMMRGQLVIDGAGTM